jgi:hypothetical protein
VLATGAAPLPENLMTVKLDVSTLLSSALNVYLCLRTMAEDNSSEMPRSLIVSAITNKFSDHCHFVGNMCIMRTTCACPVSTAITFHFPDT